MHLGFWPTREDSIVYFTRKWHAFLYHNSLCTGIFSVFLMGTMLARRFPGSSAGAHSSFPSLLVTDETPEAYAGLKKPADIDAAIGRLTPTFGQTDSRADWGARNSGRRAILPRGIAGSRTRKCASDGPTMSL